ncbi:MAG: hypothetical protein J5649_02975 [Lachnospiraceae bacterium]|nr:hypothetical protein [Lachnospiraceae bacterium]
MKGLLIHCFHRHYTTLIILPAVGLVAMCVILHLIFPRTDSIAEVGLWMSALCSVVLLIDLFGMSSGKNKQSDAPYLLCLPTDARTMVITRTVITLAYGCVLWLIGVALQLAFYLAANREFSLSELLTLDLRILAVTLVLCELLLLLCEVLPTILYSLLYPVISVGFILLWSRHTDLMLLRDDWELYEEMLAESDGSMMQMYLVNSLHPSEPKPEPDFLEDLFYSHTPIMRVLMIVAITSLLVWLLARLTLRVMKRREY